VLLDGKSVRSCQTAMSEVGGAKITTIEGLEQNGRLSPVQQAFLDEGAFQCGYCTSGMIMHATALLDAAPNPSESEIVSRMGGNICRCGTYPRIVQAVQKASTLAAKAGAR
jgi:aerobic-type carbon monoxide dehydrogenase small subunit (CoxS/CutS family)